MIVVIGTVRLATESVAAARQAAIEMARETRREPGCIAYDFASDLEDETVFRLSEVWESEAALAAHFETAHMARFRKTLGTLRLLSREITRYDVSNVRSL